MDLLKRILKWVRITRNGVGSTQFPIQQIEYNGKTADTVVLYPYGFFADIPTDTLALKAIVDDNAENRVVLGCTAPNRPQLSEGEVALYHPKTGSIIKMNSDGSIEIQGGPVTIKDDLIVEGNLAVGAAATDFLTHTHTGSLTAPVGAVSPTGVVIP